MQDSAWADKLLSIRMIGGISHVCICVAWTVSPGMPEILPEVEV